MSHRPGPPDLKRARLWTVATVALAFGAGLIAYAQFGQHSASVEPVLKTFLAASLISGGLGTLFPLAAYGPNWAGQNRVKSSVIGAAQIILAFAWLSPNLPIAVAAGFLAGLLTLGAILQVPKTFFASGSQAQPPSV